MTRFTFVISFMLALSPFTAHALTPSGSVGAPDGTYAGLATESGRQFLGIRFAQPPVGDKRWRAPEAVTPAEEINAQEFGARCVQPQDGWNFTPSSDTPMTGSEDCLFLNVYTPKATAGGLPVLVWIPGGGFVTGAGSDYDGHVLAETQNVIVVTMNYRLGALGFFAHPALGGAGGNFGLQDQQMALRWVQRNITSFGGDPSRVTVFGESAGGVSICGHLRSPASAGLFSGAIIQSGPCFGLPRVTAEDTGQAYADAAACRGTDEEVLSCLRRLPAAQAASITPGEVGAGSTPWTLVNGTDVLPRGSEVFTDGNFNTVPVINGTNRDEGRLFAQAALAGMKSRDDYTRNLRVQFGDSAAQVLEAYPVEAYASVPLAYAAYLTDFMFACPAEQASKAMAAHTQVYSYEFRDRSNSPGPDVELLPSLGAYHAKEIQFVFQTPSFFGGPADLTPGQLKLSEDIMAAWAAFARTGSPNVESGLYWPPLTEHSNEVRPLDLEGPTTIEGFSEIHNCEFWQSL